MRVFVITLVLIIAHAQALCLRKTTTLPAAPRARRPEQAPAPPLRATTWCKMCVMCSFDMSQAQMNDLKSQGLSDSDIAMAAAIARKCCHSLNEVVSAYKSCNNWSDCAKKFNVPCPRVARPLFHSARPGHRVFQHEVERGPVP